MSQLEGNRSAKQDPLRSIFLAETMSLDSDPEQTLDRLADGIGASALQALYGRLQISLLLSRGVFAAQPHNIEGQQRWYTAIQRRHDMLRKETSSIASVALEACQVRRVVG